MFSCFVASNGEFSYTKTKYDGKVNAASLLRCYSICFGHEGVLRMHRIFAFDCIWRAPLNFHTATTNIKRGKSKRSGRVHKTSAHRIDWIFYLSVFIKR